MSSKVSINVKYPEIVVPDTDTPGADTPDTGMFSTGQISDAGVSNSMLPIVGVSTISLVVLVLIAGLIIRRIKDKKCKSFAIHHAGRSILRIACLVTVLSLSVFALFEYGSHKMDAVEATGTSTTPVSPSPLPSSSSLTPGVGEELSVTTEGVDINVVLDNTPVFATTKSTVTVNAATTNGYTLMAYVDSNTSDLTNETNTNATTKITGLESSYSQPLTENTWGVALSLPENQDAPVFHGLPTKKEDAMMIKVTGSTATNANDTTELYYATYVTPDLEEGTYTGATVNYVAISNPVGDDITVKFNTYNEDTDMDELYNTVTYGIDCSMVYIGSSCQKAYAGKTTTYELPEHLEYDTNYNMYYYLEPIRVTGVDMLKIDIEIGSADVRRGVEIIKGAYSSMAAIDRLHDEVSSPSDLYNLVSYMYSDPSSSTKTLYTQKNDLTLLYYNTSDNGNSFRATITPIYFEKPSGVETTETSFCRRLEVRSIDDGQSIQPINEVDSIFNVFSGELGGDMSILSAPFPILIRPVTLPNADGVRAEITYDLPSKMTIGLAEGIITTIEEPPENFNTISSGSGSKTFDYNGDTVSFLMMLTKSFRNLSLSVNYYPLYNHEIENTVPVQTCRFTNKSGTYREPAEFSQGGYWRGEFDMDGDGSGDSVFLNDEAEIKSFLQSSYDTLRGQTIDVYEIFP